MVEELRACPACESQAVAEIYRLDAVPVQSCILLDSEAEARSFPRRPLQLKFCDDCGFVFNAVFDLALVDYASTTEESQHFSGTFNRFAKNLASEIASIYDLKGKQTVEIGCGKGEFLQELSQQTGTRGLGVDPGFIPDRLPGADGHDIYFQREYFDSTTITDPPDFVVCRHTLEHIPEVGRFMNDIARMIGNRSDVGIFFETPDVRRVLDEGAFWDIYYEHCSYFTLGSHARLFRRHGMDVTKLYLAYDNQYIIQYAKPTIGSRPLPEEDDLDTLRALAKTFPRKVAETRAYWTDFVQTRHAAGKRVAIWGGGSKGVSFLTTNGLGPEVAQVVDINPFKQGRFLPGTGHRVCGPESLKHAPPDTVIVMNPIYLDEIGSDLAKNGLAPELVAV
ncbi:Methyltransferase domain-containing protein [Roseivivax lentus]|uniref:Methyltransferase domain-containing protein n=1 Tax=Roseivivax lentus TaxID=633194 RepID=A0A1N7Q271_9RHOB|nr:class I SAM-dependent methyltransferase [Roseivivax lentus]SIT16984.1 Methyltransferase domain-containing protein [Roseivivax lentus]